MTNATFAHGTAELAASGVTQAPLRVVACAGRSDRGARRDVNEDAVLMAAPLLAVADGVGGNRAGDEASALALDIMRRDVPALADDPAHELRRAVHRANEAVRAAASAGGREGMATTVVAALVGPADVTLVHVGDSRGSAESVVDLAGAVRRRRSSQDSVRLTRTPIGARPPDRRLAGD